MSFPVIYRKRLIPSECIPLSNDKIVRFDDSMIVTTWNTIRPRNDFHHGCSCYYRNKGWKVSRFFREDGSLKYTYCDIVGYETDEAAGRLTVVDLLADVIVYPDGYVKVVDLDELAAAVRQGLMTGEQLNTCLINLNALLSKIYDGKLDALTAPLDSIQ